MNLQQLETFHWIARLGSFTEAGNRLYVPQPTVSMRVRELEDELGVKLIERSGRRIRLTHRGRLLAEQAARVVELITAIRHNVGAPQEVTGLVRIGVAELVATTWLPELVRELNTRFPGLTIELKLELSQTLITELDSGKLDLLLAPGPPRSASRYHLHYLGSVELAFMANPGLIPVGTDPLTPDELCGLPLVAMGSQSILHDVEESWFMQADGPLRRIDVANNLTIAAQLTAAGLGVSVLPPEIYPRWIEEGRLRVIETQPPLPPLHFFMIWSRQDACHLAELILPLAREISTFRQMLGDDCKVTSSRF